MTKSIIAKKRKARFQASIKQTSKTQSNKFTPAANESIQTLLEFVKKETGKKLSKSKLIHNLIESSIKELHQNGEISNSPYLKETVMKDINSKLSSINRLNFRAHYPSLDRLNKVNELLSEVVKCVKA